MIGTEQVASTASHADRNTVLQFLGRAEVAQQLQSMGVDVSTAKDRVAAMSDQELSQIAGKIQSMPAGADSTGTVIVVLLIAAAVVWWVWFRR